MRYIYINIIHEHSKQHITFITRIYTTVLQTLPVANLRTITTTAVAAATVCLVVHGDELRAHVNGADESAEHTLRHLVSGLQR